MRYCILLIGALWSGLALGDPVITVTPDKSSAVYQPGEKIVWNVKAASPVLEASYVLKKGGAAAIGQGTLDLKDNAATITTSLDEPGTILAEVTYSTAAEKNIKVLAGAVVAPDRIKPSLPCPDDFDTFWKTKLGQLGAVPEHPVLEKEDSGKPGVDYWKITLDNINGTKVQGQLARPSAQGKKLPALLIVQWAGVYPLAKVWATDHAAEGWLVLNIMAHDLPIDQPKDYYENLKLGALKDYTAIGNDDREKSYFLRMFLGDIRAVEYLAKRPDWDGKTLVVTGNSQGGLQSFVAAALDSKVTAIVVLVPAGCDNSGRLAGREPGWPFWMNSLNGHDEKQVLQTSRYFDAVNFASHTKCPALVGLGLIDVTAPPSGIFAAISQLSGTKEVVILPNSNHHGDGHTQVPFMDRAKEWLAALSTGAPPPAKP
jgi:cephalosporin-C deacetylase-like acetyl esterase